MDRRLGIAIALLSGISFGAMAIHPRAHAETVKGESTDKKKMTGTQSSGGGGGAGAPLTKTKAPIVKNTKPKKKMLNPQPEPPG